MYYRYGLLPGSSVCRAAVILVAAMTTTCSAHVAVAASVLSLAEAERLALEAEPGRAALESRAEAAEHRAVAADSLPLPRLRVGLNNYPFESGDFSTEGMTNASVGIRQAFPPGDSRRLEAEQLSWEATSLTESAGLRTRAVKRATRDAWLSVRYWQEAAGQVQATRPFFEDLVTTTQSLYAVGRKTQQDVLRAELELSRLEDRLLDMASEEAVARARLAEWIGEAARLPVAVDLPPWDRVPAAPDLIASLDEHPSLRVASADLESSRTAVALATERKKVGWALDVGYAYRDGELRPGVDRSNFITVGVTVDLPFTRGKSIDSALTAALRERSAAEHDRTRERRSLESALVAEHARYTELSRRQALYEDRILAQVRAHAAAALDAYRSDTADFADVMRAYIDDLDTRTEFLRLSTERAKSFAALAYLGGL